MDATAGFARTKRWYHGWNIVAVCVLAQIAALALTLNCFSLFLADWTREFGVPVSELAFGITLFAIGTAIVVPFVGVVVDRFPARWVFGLSLASLVLFHAAIGFTTSAWQIVALYGVLLPLAIGFSSGVPSQALVSRWFVRRAGLAMGLTAFGIAAAGVIFPSLIVWLLPILGWRQVWFLFAAAVAVVVLPIVVLVVRDRPVGEEGAHYVGAGHAAHTGPKLTTMAILRRRNFWVTIGLFVPVQCAWMAISINLAPLVASYGFDRTTAGIMLSVGSAAALTAKLGAGLLADRLGNRIPMVMVALSAAAGTALLATYADRLPILYVAMVLLGFSGGIWTLLASTTAAEFGAHGFGRAFGLICAATPIGSLAPPLLARSEELSGSYAPGLWVLAAMAVVAAGIALLLRERPRAVAAAAV